MLVLIYVNATIYIHCPLRILYTNILSLLLFYHDFVCMLLIVGQQLSLLILLVGCNRCYMNVTTGAFSMRTSKRDENFHDLLPIFSIRLSAIIQNGWRDLAAPREFKVKHDAVMTWKQFPQYWPFLGMGQVGGFTGNGPVMRSYDVYLMLVRRNCWADTQVASELRHHDAHVTSL